jgi:acyl-CoA synthetase (AMP-forming)/AMP-acid ligase II
VVGFVWSKRFAVYLAAGSLFPNVVRHLYLAVRQVEPRHLWAAVVAAGQAAGIDHPGRLRIDHAQVGGPAGLDRTAADVADVDAAAAAAAAAAADADPEDEADDADAPAAWRTPGGDTLATVSLDATAAAFTDDGWYRTGDLATRDEDGYFYFRGRKDDLIITSGYRVSPTEVETVLREDPLVSDAVVGGVPDPERGQRVKAFVVLADESDVGEDEHRQIGDRLKEHVSETLGAYKSPHEVEFVEDPPETRTGKLDRSELFST